MSIFKNLFFQGYKKSNIPFYLMDVMGYALGWDYQQKFGIARGVTSVQGQCDVWEFKGLYPWSDYGVNDIVSLSSSSASDTIPILVIGQTADGVEVRQVVTLQGRTRVPLTTPLWRVYRMENFKFAPGVDIAGTVYCFSGTEVTDGVPDGASVVKAVIVNGNNQTQMMQYTIPANTVAFLRRAEIGFGFSGTPGAGAQQVEGSFRVRSYQNVFKVKKTKFLISTGSTEHIDVRPFPDPLPALSDITTTIEATTATVSVDSTMHLWLADERHFPGAYLAKIGQPGYV